MNFSRSEVPECPDMNRRLLPIGRLGSNLRVITMLMFLCISPSSGWPTAAQDSSNPSHRHDLAHGRESSPTKPVSFAFKGSDFLKWTELDKTKLAINSSERALLLNMTAESHSLTNQDHPYSVSLACAESGVHDRWYIRYVRDSTFQVAIFEVGATFDGKQSEISLPLNLIAIDSPTPGRHVYSIQVMYVGDVGAVDSGRLKVENGQFEIVKL